MSDKTRFLFGLCKFSVRISVESLLNHCLRSKIELFQVSQKQSELFFYCTIDQKNEILKLYPDAVYHGTTGFLGFILKELKRPFHLLLLFWSVVLYLMLSHILFQIQFQSTNQALQNRIEQYLTEQKIQPGLLVTESSFDDQLKQNLHVEFMHEIAWVEVQRSASILKISFNHKESVEIHSFESEPLISTKHAIVNRFQILHGYKVVKTHQVVYPGDVLVQPYLIDSSGNTQELFVSGKVYGTTWYTIQSELSQSGFLEVLDYFRLLMDCRRQIEKEISEGEEVLKENILQVVSTEGKIRMTVHYTCLEDITKE